MKAGNLTLLSSEICCHVESRFSGAYVLNGTQALVTTFTAHRSNIVAIISRKEWAFNRDLPMSEECRPEALPRSAGVIIYHHAKDRLYSTALYLLVIGSLLSRPKARGVIFTPGGAWRRLYSLRSTRRITRSTVLRSKPIASISSKVRSSSA